MTNDAAAFGVRLSACRRSAGLSQQELALRSGLSIRTVSNLERGRTKWPHPSSVRRLADALGLHGEARGKFFAAAERRMVHDTSTPAGAVPGSRPGRAELSNAADGRLLRAGASRGPGAAERERHQAGHGVVPRQLPAAVPAFVGRRAELAVLSETLHQPDETAVVTVVGGTAGVGKTALAVHWAHQVAQEFPDGQLFMNLRGFDLSESPVTPADAVRVFLDALQIPADVVPSTVEARLSLYRSLLAGKRMLVVLDNARDAAQVRPLLPGTSTCRVVVTSRDQLAGLAAIEAARPVALEVLTDGEARDLLARRLGTGRVAAEPAAVVGIVASCARLPLALCVIAARAALRPDLSLVQVADNLAAQPGLGGFTGDGDSAADVRAAFSWSYRQLPADAARAFRLASLHPGPDFDRYAIAALTGATADATDHLLDVLTRVCMIQPAGPDRYGLHDLLRGYARELADVEDGEDGQRAALTGLFDYYLYMAVTAVNAAFPAERLRLPAGQPPPPGPPVADEAAALAWLAAERPSLVAVAVHAAGHGWPGHATRLSATLFRYLDTGAHYTQALAIHGSAGRAARYLGDRAAEANALNSLGVMEQRQGRYQQATGHFEQALPRYREAGDQTGEARVLSNLGFTGFLQGRGQQAAGYLRQSLDMFRDIGDRAGEARVLASLGFVDLRQGRYQQATSHLRQSAALCRETRDKGGEARALGNLGEVELRQGRYRQAAGYVEQALALFREIDDRTSQTDTLTSLGLIDLRQGRHQQAAARLRQALDLCRDTGDLSSQATALNALGELLLATARPADARAQHAAALRVAIQAGETYEQAHAHDGLASSYQASGRLAKARHHWQEALACYENLGAPEAHEVRTKLGQKPTDMASR
jgi:tetratricopeptide (TPR) repeat protein/transcriptional regulator with XRE-family HTH domain